MLFMYSIQGNYFEINDTFYTYDDIGMLTISDLENTHVVPNCELCIRNCFHAYHDIIV